MGEATTALLREATTTQRRNAGARLELGLVLYPRARATSVRWLATALTWPTPVVAVDFGAGVAKAVDWVRSATSLDQRVTRVERLLRQGRPDRYLSAYEAWFAAYEEAMVSLDLKVS